MTNNDLPLGFVLLSIIEGFVRNICHKRHKYIICRQNELMSQVLCGGLIVLLSD